MLTIFYLSETRIQGIEISFVGHSEFIPYNEHTHFKTSASSGHLQMLQFVESDEVKLSQINWPLKGRMRCTTTGQKAAGNPSRSPSFAVFLRRGRSVILGESKHKNTFMTANGVKNGKVC